VNREAVAHLQATLGLSERRAAGLSRHQSGRPPDTELRQRLRDLTNERCRCRWLYILLRREGETSGINRIYRLNREESLVAHRQRVSDLLCMSNLSHASPTKEHDGDNDFQGITGRVA